jgi:hypothetical protein
MLSSFTILDRRTTWSHGAESRILVVGYDSRGYDSRGYDSRGYDSRGYDSRGYDSRGYDSVGVRCGSAMRLATIQRCVDDRSSGVLSYAPV